MPQPPSTARELFEQARLSFPPVPAALVGPLAPHGPSLFATRDLEASPYFINLFLGELELDPRIADYAVVGFDGHGMTSWAVHCYIVSGPLALFIQLPWGGAYTDEDRARAEITAMFAWGAQLQAKSQRALERGRIRPGWRLEVVASRFGHAGWRWLAPGEGADVQAWQPAGGMKAALLKMLDEL